MDLHTFLNISQPGEAFYWICHVFFSVGGSAVLLYRQEELRRSASYYLNMSNNIQLSYYTTGGSFIQVSSPSGTGSGLLILYYIRYV